MSEMLKDIATDVGQRFGAEVQEFRGETTLIIDPPMILDALGVLKAQYQFNTLLDITAVDYFPQQSPRFHLIYQLYSMSHNQLLRLRVPLNGNAPVIGSAEKIYANANWKEREVWDLIGIRFEGHSDMRRIEMPYDWEGHPLRKDYPLGYEEPQFTFNYEDIELRKPYAKGLR